MSGDFMHEHANKSKFLRGKEGISMKRKHTKMIALLMAGAMTLSMAGCGSAGGTDSAAQTNQTEDTAKAEDSAVDTTVAESEEAGAEGASYTFPLEEPIEISALTMDFNRDRTQYADQLYEQYTNVKINWTMEPASDLFTVVNLKLNSGELPDMLVVNKTLADQFADQGLFVDFMDYLDQMPNLKAWMEKIPAIYNDTVDGEGHLYCLTNFNTRGQVPRQPIYRKDLFEKENLSVPETIDELYEDLVILKEKYPDSIPIVSRWGANNLIGHVANLYQCQTSYYLDEDSQTYEYGPATDKFKAAISTLQKFYAAGLIDPEFATVSDDQFVDRITSGRALFMFAEYTCCLHTEGEGDWNGNGQKNNPDFELAPMPVVDTEFGEGQLQVQSPTGRGGYAIAVSAESEHIDQIMALIDYQLSDEMINLVNWGVEGETYEVTDGQKNWLIDAETKKEMGLDARTGMWIPIDQDCSDANLDEADRAIVQEANGKVDEFAMYDPKVTIGFSPEEQDLKSEIMTPVTTYVDEELMNFITGKKNMEADWEAFQETLKDMGYETVLSMYREKYDALPEEQKGFDADLGL